MGNEVIHQREIPSLRWLASKSEISDMMLGHVLYQFRSHKILYSKVSIPKPKGGVRILSIPNTSLMKVQRAINRNVLTDYFVHNCVFGFSGGSIIEAITPHLKSKVLLSFDVVNAFDNVGYRDVMDILLEGRISDYWTGIERHGQMSWYAARAVSQITTLDDYLPQGAPTSPRLFDLAFKSIDYELSYLAEKYDGIFTRYADNIFFSLLNKTYFPPKMERAVLRTIGKSKNNFRWHKFRWHKRSVRRLDRGAIRILGMNVIEGEISVPRDYKRNLRLSLHHIRYLLDNNMFYEEPWLRLKGQMTFSSLGVLPESLVRGYEDLKKEIEGL